MRSPAAARLCGQTSLLPEQLSPCEDVGLNDVEVPPPPSPSVAL